MIITFYSYKGGVGRSMALANVAQWLYSQGLRVVVVDWDLEAPGIESYFEPDEAKRRGLCEGRGVMDLLVSYRSAHGSMHALHAAAAQLAPATTEDEDEDEIGEPGPMSDEEKVKLLRGVLPSLAFFLQPVGESPRPAPHGTEAGLWLMSAGARQGERFAEYARNVHSFDWSGFYSKHDGSTFFRWLREELESFADIVLVDSRTGVTEMSGVCTRDLADRVVSFCAPNEANLNGVIRMTRWFLEPQLASLRPGRPLRAMIIPCRLDHASETKELEHFKARFFEEVATLRQLDPQVDASVWWDLQIRYISRYSFHELIVIGQRGESEYLQDDLQDLAKYLAKLYIADGGEEATPLLARQLGPEVRELLETGGIEPDMQAEVAFARVRAEERDRTLSLLARLVRVERPEVGGVTSPIRRSLDEFDVADQPLITQLVSLGLLLTAPDERGVTCIQLANAAYATQWKRFAEFLNEDSAFLLWRQRLDGYLSDYQHHADDPAALLSGQLLEEAKRYATTRGNDLTAAEHQYILKSEAHTTSVRQQAAAAAARARRSMVVVGIIAAVVAVATISFQGVRNGVENRRAAEVVQVETEADTALMRGDYLGAIEHLDRALQLDPTHTGALLKRGSTKVAASRLPGQKQLLDAGIEDLTQVIDLDANIPEAFRARASALARRSAAGDPERADADYTRAMELDPANAMLVFERARLRDSLGKAQEALADYSKAIELDPQYAESYFYRGMLLGQQGEREKASADFRQTIDIGSDPALTLSANTELERLGYTQLIQRKPRVVMQYTDKRDAALVKDLGKELTQAELDVSRAELRNERVDGDVRYYYPEDQAIANRIKVLTETALAARGVRLNLELIYLSAQRWKGAARGQVEVWLPSLTAGMNVDIFWCEESGTIARAQAEKLEASKNSKWRGRWNVRALPGKTNAEASYQATGYEIRISSDTESIAADELREWMAARLGIKDISVLRTTQDTPGYISVFICPRMAAAQ